jgi:hypothetical protein
MPIVILIALLVFIRARLKFGSDFFIVFSLYLAINFRVELSSSIIAHYNFNNLWIYNISILTEGLTFCYIFYYVNNSKPIRKAVIISVMLFASFWIADFCFIQGNRNLNTYTYLLSCIILSVFSLITIYQFVFQNSFNNPFYNFFFWASIGILFCYLGNVPYLASFNILVIRDPITAYRLNIISQVVNSILYCMIITGILCHHPQKN